MDTSRLAKAAEILKTISHPVRLDIIKMLDKDEPLSVAQINEQIPIPQPALSHHLNKMKDRGVLASHREGKNVYYSLMSRHIIKIFDCIESCDII